MSSGTHSVLITSPLAIQSANPGKLRLMINVLNVSSVPRNGELQILGLGGNPLSTTNYVGIAPNGGTGDELIITPGSGAADITLVYGRVTVDDKPDSIRASLIIADDPGNTIVSVEAR